MHNGSSTRAFAPPSVLATWGAGPVGHEYHEYSTTASTCSLRISADPNEVEQEKDTVGNQAIILY